MTNKAHLGNPSGTRGSGSKENVGATVKTVTFAKEVAKSIRIVCLSLYGRADKETVTRHVTNLALADWQEWDNKTFREFLLKVKKISQNRINLLSREIGNEE